MKAKIFLTLAFLLFASSSYAGSPNYISPTNKLPYFFKWQKGIVKIYLDPGNLAEGIDKQETRNIIDSAIGRWNDVKMSPTGKDEDEISVSNINMEVKDYLSEDIDGTNYHKYFFEGTDGNLGAFNPTRPTVIIFDEFPVGTPAKDEDGKTIKDENGNDKTLSIMEDMQSRGSRFDPTTTFGLTDLYARDDYRMYIKNGTVILNGPLLEDEASVTGKGLIEAVVVHELGHLLNMDHSAVNEQYVDGNNSCGDDCEYLPTMYKWALSPAQRTLNYDDKVWIAFLYNWTDEPSPINKDFCRISGEVLDREGRGFQGAEITVSDISGLGNDASVYTMTSITGSFFKPCTISEGDIHAGQYIVPGLVPGRKYKVTYGSIPDWCDNNGACGLGSGINPYDPRRNTGSEGDVAFFGEGGGYIFECEEGGQILNAESVYVEADLSDSAYWDYPGYFQCPIEGEPEDGEENSEGEGVNAFGVPLSKGWCSLVAGSSSNTSFLWFFLPAALLLIHRKRNYK